VPFWPSAVEAFASSPIAVNRSPRDRFVAA
jgi:hypothetical protein